ncbi:tetratricopeptide repeat protein [Kordiimonas marina]|uniref:tetratricopeptide repeat protein n=1 Tax=Kordiimonas marina TaxID=2872312 RepID=UPI001FF5868A|nr:tetratricopeptide repeat protein [Kordiimonas marina]MCJ9429910.1 tetratricopeptide repeat protein [Kordiimonas marina]
MMTRSSIAVILVAASLQFSLPAVAAPSPKDATALLSSLKSDEERYSKCMSLAEQSPDAGINMALVWQGQGGGVPARHCEAIGLFHEGEYGEAAARLMLIAEDMRTGKDMPVQDDKRVVADASMLADMYDQAANAWLLAKETMRAENAIDMALAVVEKGTSQQQELKIDRARIAAADHDYDLALRDLRDVQKADPGRDDILILIASAARGLGKYDQAKVALDNYMKTHPDNSTAYLEKGNLAYALGDKDGARQAWVKVLLLTQKGPDAKAARDNIEKMDLEVKPGK